MEVLVLVGLVATGFVAMALALKASFWILFAIALPVFWLWMLIDAIARREEDYPSKSTNEKILWIVLILIVHVSVIVYWFVVYLAGRKRISQATSPTSAPQGAMAPASNPAVPTPPPAV